MKTFLHGRQLRVLAALALAGLLLFSASSVLAGGATTWTQHFDAIETNPDMDQCTGTLGDVTLAYKAVLHTTETPNGHYHFTGKFVGDFVFVPYNIYDPPRPTAAGKFRTEVFDTFNGKGETHMFNFKVHGTRSDGTTVQWHLLWHATMNANGEWVVDYFGLNCP